MKIKRSKIKKLIKQQRKGYLRNCIVAINIDALPSDIKFDTKYWLEIMYQKGFMIMNEPEDFHVIKYKPRKL